MAHFPQPNHRLRAARVRIPNSESVNFKIGAKRVVGVLQKLSLTGGLAEIKEDIEPAPLAEVAFNTGMGPVNALVEILRPSPKRNSQNLRIQPFRFIAMNDVDYERLVSTLQSMRRQGLGDDTS